jgi:hypothetical protein
MATPFLSEKERNMRPRTVAFIFAATVLTLAALAGCQVSGHQGAAAEVTTDDAGLPPTSSAPSPGIEREFWLAIAQEPGLHLAEARELYLAGDMRGASADLVKVASMLKFEARHSPSEDEARPLLLAVEELREVASVVRSEEGQQAWTPNTKPIDRVSARTYRALGTHHLALSRKSLDAGDALMAGRYIKESANDIEQGFARANEQPGAVMEKDLGDARILADRLAWNGDGDQAEARTALGRLDDALNGLGEVLGSRRK